MYETAVLIPKTEYQQKRTLLLKELERSKTPRQIRKALKALARLELQTSRETIERR